MTNVQQCAAWPVLAAIGLLFFTGCDKRPEAEFPESLSVEDYGRLPGLKGSSLDKLQDEYFVVVEQQGTPEMLDASAAAVTGGEPSQAGQKKPGAAGQPSVASGLADVYTKRTFQSLKDAVEKNYPHGRFEFNALQLRAAAGLLDRHRRELLKSRAALKRPHRGFGVRHTRGFANDCSFIDHVRMSARLEGLAAAESLFLNDDPEQAIAALKNMLRWAELLAAEKHVTARLQAGLLRDESLEVLQAIVLHPSCRPQHLEILDAIVDKQIENWPQDAGAWIGDRALGMHSYEAIRDGKILFLLTDREVADFTENGTLEDLAQAAIDVADRDELFYLGAMRRIIESCRLPYYKRSDVAAKILAEAEAKANSPDYPLVAARLLLPNIDNGLHMQAEDRAAVAAWAAALDAALGRPVANSVDPVTGKKFQISRRKDKITVTQPSDGSQVIIPVR